MTRCPVLITFERYSQAQSFKMVMNTSECEVTEVSINDVLNLLKYTQVCLLYTFCKLDALRIDYVM